MQVFHMENKPTCPQCGAVLDATTPADPESSAEPSAGDITVCLHCAAALKFVPVALKLEKLTTADLMALPDSYVDYLAMLQNETRKVIAEKEGKNAAAGE